MKVGPGVSFRRWLYQTDPPVNASVEIVAMASARMLAGVTVRKLKAAATNTTTATIMRQK